MTSSMKSKAFVMAGMMAAVLINAMSTVAYTPNPDVGYSAGLLPECPGVMKNVSINPGLMPLFRIIAHYDRHGQFISKSMPILGANKIISKDKHIDLINKKTVFYAVGYVDSSIFPQSQAVCRSYVKLGYNVFISETFALLTNEYVRSVQLSRAIGREIGELLVQLTELGLRPENLELVGLSLGAHVVSYAAKYFYEKTGQKPSRLTGLDPAGPCFRGMPLHLRFNAADAERVDVIHTNIDGFGMAEKIGHVDFYVNGGEYQPSDVQAIPCLVVCSHFKAAIYWWLGLENAKKFIGVKCDTIQEARLAKCFSNSDTNYLGLQTNFQKEGIYYLSTSNEFPYFRGKAGLSPENKLYTNFVRTDI